MAQVINTNVMSLNAQRQLNKTQAASNEAMERLSSGLRINSAKDDAAGLAISTSMNSQITGLTQAVRNSNDGISMAQTAEGAMDEMTNILQRIRELSVQSANDTNSAENRVAIQEEVDQLNSELDRIAETTEFNGKKLLDGSSGSTTLQIGANSGQTLTFDIDSVTSNSLGLNGNLNKEDLNSGRVGETATTEGQLLVNGVDIGDIALKSGNQAGAIVDAINLKSSETGVTASAYNVMQGSSESTDVTGITNGMLINGIELPPTSSMDNLVETINRDIAGITASKGDNGELLLTNDTGEDIVIGSEVLETNVATAKSALTTAESTYVGQTTTFGNAETTYQNAVSLVATETAAYNQALEDDAANGTTLADSTARDNAITALGDSTVGAQKVYDDAVTLYSSQTDTYNLVAQALDDADPNAFASGITSGTYTGFVALASADDSPIAVTGAAPTSAGFLESNGAGSMVLEAPSVSAVTGDDKLTVNGEELIYAAGTDAATTGTNAAAAINALSDKTGVTASADSTTGVLTLSSKDGSAIEIVSGADTQEDRTAALTKLGMQSEMGGKFIGSLGLNVSTMESASNTIDKVDAALDKISASRANLGAIQNRLDSTISNLENVSQNLSASNSRIQDADFAAETSNLSKAQILQQAGTAMLSQANSSGENVLSLLQ